MEFKPEEGGEWITLGVENNLEESFIARRLHGIPSEEVSLSNYPFETGTSKENLANLAKLALLSGDIEEIRIGKQIVNYFEAQASSRD